MFTLRGSYENMGLLILAKIPKLWISRIEKRLRPEFAE